MRASRHTSPALGGQLLERERPVRAIPRSADWPRPPAMTTVSECDDRPSCGGHDRQRTPIRNQHRGVAVAQHVGQLVGFRRGVDRHEHCAGLKAPKIESTASTLFSRCITTRSPRRTPSDLQRRPRHSSRRRRSRRTSAAARRRMQSASASGSRAAAAVSKSLNQQPALPALRASWSRSALTFWTESRFSGNSSRSATAIPNCCSRKATSSRTPVESMMPFSRNDWSLARLPASCP